MCRTPAPVFREVPVRPNNRTTPMSRLAPAGLDTLTAWLATIASMIGKLAQQARRKNVASVKDWQVHLVQTIAQPSNGLVREWSTTNRSAEIYAVWLAVGRAANSTVDVPTLEIAKATIMRVMKAAANRQRELSRLHWDRQVAKMVQGAMGLAHRWANAPNRGVFILTALGAHSLSAVVNWHAGAWSKVWQANKPEVVDNTLSKVNAFLAEVRKGTDGSRSQIERQQHGTQRRNLNERLATTS